VAAFQRISAVGEAAFKNDSREGRKMSWFLIPLFLASTPDALSLDDVLRRTREAFPSLVAAGFDVKNAQGEALAAEGAFDPQWKTKGAGVVTGAYPQLRVDSTIEVPTTFWGTSFIAGYRLGTGNIADYYRERETLSLGEVRVGASVPVLRNGPIDRRRANTAKAQIAVEIAQLSLDQQHIEISRLASIRYWDWVAAGARLRVATQLLSLAQARASQLNSRELAGDTAAIDTVDNQRALFQRQSLSAQAERQVEQSSLELSLFLRDAAGNPLVPNGTQIPIAFQEPQVSPVSSQALETALEMRPDVRRLKQQVAQLEVEVRLLSNGQLPALDVGVMLAQDIGDSTRPELKGLRQPEFEITASLEVPLLMRAQNGKLDAARASLNKGKAQLQLAQNRVRVEINDALSALSRANERLVAARNEIVAATKLETGERTRFSLGDSTLLFVNIREQQMAEAKLREIDAIHDARRAEVSLVAALGQFAPGYSSSSPAP
jgi:outer membrane protein, heavy metal efflux system